MIDYIIGIAVWLACVGAWITHITHSIEVQAYLFALVGAIVAPVGVVNGIGILLGVWA